MKNNGLFFRIYISLIAAFTIILMILSILGNKTRIGYISEFNLGINETLELNNLLDLKNQYIKDDKLDEEGLKDYILTNENIKEYSYYFKVKYYDKVFRNSDIYGVYLDTNKIIKDNNFIKKINMNDNGSPFGNLISDKIIDFEKIDNIDYRLNISTKLIGIYILLILFFIILYNKKIFLFIFKNKISIKFYFAVLFLSLISFSILSVILNKNGMLNLNNIAAIKSGIYIFILILLFISFIFIVYYYLYKYLKYKKSLNYNEYSNLNKIEIITIILFIFHYWLFSPGYFHYIDTTRTVDSAILNIGNNWDPVILEISIRVINNFGFTMNVLFTINLLLWYVGIFILVVALYARFKNVFAAFLLLISFIGNIFFTNIEYLKDYTSTLYLWFSCSLIFYLSINDMKNIFFKNTLIIISLVTLIIGMLHRHNFIVTVYPILMFFVYYVLDNYNFKNVKKYALVFISVMLFNAIVLISINFIFPRIFVKDITKTVSYHMMYAQITGCLVPANDDTIIPDYWYRENKDFEDLSVAFNEDPIRLDITYNQIFDPNKTDNIKEIWIKSLKKYPLNYIKHTFKYIANMWTRTYNDDIYNGFNYYTPIDQISKYNNDQLINFYKTNSPIVFTPAREQIFIFINDLLPQINILVFIVISIMLFFISSFLWIFNKKFRIKILLLCFCTSFSSVATALIVILFIASVGEKYRYIHPVSVISIMSLISFITFIYEIGGLKKFLKELRGNR